MTSANQLHARLAPRRLIAFSIVSLALGGVGMPLSVYLPAYYAQHLGMSLSLVGMIFMVSRLWNAISDPVIGVLSDRTGGRFGRRKPWIAVGGALLLVSTAIVFMPDTGASGTFLAGWLFVLYLGWSMLSIPLYAWSGDLSELYHERTRIQTYLQTMASLGLALVLLIPTLLDWLGNDDPARKIALMGWFTIVALSIGLPILILFFRERPRSPNPQPVGLGTAIRLLATNTLVLRLMGSDFFVAVGQGLRAAMFVFFVSFYMGLPQWTGLLFLIQFLFGIFAAPIWMRVGYRLGKHRAVVAGEITQIAINLGLLLLSPGQLGPLLALTVAQGLAQGSGNLMLRAIVADVADLHRLETGEERSGLLFSVFNVTTNAAMAIALGVAFPVLGWLGFAPAGHNSPAALEGLHLFFGLGPALGHALSALLIARFPLDERRHAEIAQALAATQLPRSAPLPAHVPAVAGSPALAFARSR